MIKMTKINEIEGIIKKKTHKYSSLINHLIWGIAISMFVITVCFVGIIAAMYFFVVFVAQQLLEFIKTVPITQASLISIVTVALTYIHKKYK
jgi:hypothetical protein